MAWFLPAPLPRPGPGPFAPLRGRPGAAARHHGGDQGEDRPEQQDDGRGHDAGRPRGQAAACRMRSCREDTCCQAGMAWPAQSLSNTLSLAASWGSDRSRPTSMSGPPPRLRRGSRTGGSAGRYHRRAPRPGHHSGCPAPAAARLAARPVWRPAGRAGRLGAGGGHRGLLPWSPGGWVGLGGGGGPGGDRPQAPHPGGGPRGQAGQRVVPGGGGDP